MRNKNLSHNSFVPWGIVKHSVPEGSVLDPLHFLLCIHDISTNTNEKSKLTVFEDDTNIVFNNPNIEDFKNDIKIEFES